MCNCGGCHFTQAEATQFVGKIFEYSPQKPDEHHQRYWIQEIYKYPQSHDDCFLLRARFWTSCGAWGDDHLWPSRLDRFQQVGYSEKCPFERRKECSGSYLFTA